MFLFIDCRRIIFHKKCKVKIFCLTWARGHFYSRVICLHCYFYFFPELWYIPRVGRVEAASVKGGPAIAAWAGDCQLLLLYFPKLWSAETGDLILILIGFFWIEMRVEILELPASSQDIGSLFLWDYHYNTSFSTVHKAAITKQNSFFIQHQEDLSKVGWCGFEK